MLQRWKSTGLAVFCCLTEMIAGHSASAAEITIVSAAGPMPEVMSALVPMFERASGNKVTISFVGTPAALKLIKEGAAIDVIIANPEPVDELEKDGLLAPSGNFKLMHNGVALAVREGAAKPDISTPEKLTAALLAAKTVGYSQGASGQHFLTVIARLGIADAIKAKAVIVRGQPVGSVIAKGDAEIGVQQVAELLPVSGITLVGPLPGDLQKIVGYSAGILAKAKEADAARVFVKYLSTEAAVTAMKHKGMDPSR